jgi:Big-like domain-containing protein
MSWARIFHLLLLTSVGLPVWAQSISVSTLPDTPLYFAAMDLTTNGIPGLTNTAPRLMVSGVSLSSAHAGTVSLVTTQAWAQRYDGPLNWHDNPLKVVVDGMQNVIVSGYSFGSGFDNDFATVKYATDGTPLWTNRFDGPAGQDDLARQVAVDAAGNVFVVGESQVSSTVQDIVTIKYSPGGAMLWASHFNQHGTNFHQSSDLAVDAQGNSFVTMSSFYSDELPFITVKYNPSGTAVWTNFYEGSANGLDFAKSVAVDAGGNVFVGGSSSETDLGYIYTLIKYTTGGTALWTNHYSRDGNEILSAMTLDRDGNIIVTGDSMSPTHLYVTVKYSNAGIPLWTNLLPTPNYQGGNVPDVLTDVAGNIFVLGGSPSADVGNADFTIVKLSPAGTLLWTNRFFDISTGNSAPGGIEVDNAGNFYFAGHSTGPGGMNKDFVTVKYAGNGNAIWTNRFNGLTPDSGDYLQSIAGDDAGNVYITGLSGGFGGDGDFATVKYSDYVRYLPPTNFVGTDAFTFSVVDHFGNSATGVVTVVVLPPNLQFNVAPPNLQLGPTGLRLQVDGARGANPVVIDASTNLVNWTPVVTNIPVLGSVQFVDHSATNLPRRFYRARQLQ